VTGDTLTKANELTAKIATIDSFLRVIRCMEGRDKNNFISIRIETTRRMRLFGSFYFGLGRNEKSITLPSSCYQDIVKMYRKKRDELELERESL
jgi:hypothetical protein